MTYRLKPAFRQIERNYKKNMVRVWKVAENNRHCLFGVALQEVKDNIGRECYEWYRTNPLIIIEKILADAVFFNKIPRRKLDMWQDSHWI